MHLRLSASHALQQTVSQRQHLTQSQRLTVRNMLFDRRRELIQRLTGDNLNPKARCPSCDHRMTPAEILRGFVDDVRDYTTRCTKCGQRFPPKLTQERGASVVEVAYYCPTQTVGMLTEMQQLSPEKIRAGHAAVYHSAIVHFGTLKNAFARLSMEYPFDEPRPSWREKVREYLGMLPDTEIAQCAGVSASSVRRLRVSLRIAAFSKDDLYDEVE